MTAALWIQLALLSIAALLVSLGVAIALRRSYRNTIERRRSAREQKVRKELLNLLSEDEPLTSPLVALQGPYGKSMEVLAWQFLTKVRGASRQALVDVLIQRGAIERERRRTHKIGAVGRSKAAERLGAAGLSETSADVARLLTDRHAEVRIVAARALGKLGDGSAVPALLQTLEGERRVPLSIVSMALVHIGPSAISQLQASLTDQSQLVRGVCAHILGLHGAAESMQALIYLAEHDSSDHVRIHVAEALGRIGMPQCVRPLLAMLSPRNVATVRIAGAKGLALAGGQDALDALHTAVFDNDLPVARSAAEALGRLGASGEQRLAMITETDGPAVTIANESLSRGRVDIGARRVRTMTGAN